MRMVRLALLSCGAAGLMLCPAWSFDPWPRIVESVESELGVARGASPRSRGTPPDIPTRPVVHISYRVDRHLQEYFDLLPQGFSEDLHSLRAGQGWMDVGAGAAVAMVEYLLQGGKARATAVTVEGYTYKALENALRGHAGQFRYVFDPQAKKGIEDYSVSELGGQVDILTDVFGAVTYAHHVDRVLAKFGELLKEGGRAYIIVPGGMIDSVVGHKRVLIPVFMIVGAEGEIPVMEWLRAIKGFEVCPMPIVDSMKNAIFNSENPPFEIRLLELRRKSGPVVVPPLELLNYADASPVSRKYRWNR